MQGACEPEIPSSTLRADVTLDGRARRIPQAS